MRNGFEAVAQDPYKRKKDATIKAHPFNRYISLCHNLANTILGI